MLARSNRRNQLRCVVPHVPHCASELPGFHLFRRIGSEEVQTISYNLDSLGWMQFESLIQVLLKAELGLGLELWGGSADHGKDAYCAHELNFPSRHTTNPGPFVFQVKFIAGANAAGADFDSILMRAVKKEGELIKNRIEAAKWIHPKWSGPQN